MATCRPAAAPLNGMSPSLSLSAHPLIQRRHRRGCSYVCAEWTYGGIPAWLGQKDGVLFRQTNAVWQPSMEAWFNKVVTLMAEGSFFATQGGPIVLLQVENELPKTDMSCVHACLPVAALLPTE